MNGNEIIINSGTYDYSKNSIKYFRGTRGHNTIIIDEMEQHEFQNNGNSSLVSNGYIDSKSQVNDEFRVSSYHDGYKKWGLYIVEKLFLKMIVLRF